MTERDLNLLSRHLDGELSPAELEDLALALGRSPGFRSEFKKHLFLTELLSQKYDEERLGPTFLQALKTRIRADGDAPAFIRALQERVVSESGRGRPHGVRRRRLRDAEGRRSGWLWVTAASCVAAVLALLLYDARRAPERPGATQAVKPPEEAPSIVVADSGPPEIPRPQVEAVPDPAPKQPERVPAPVQEPPAAVEAPPSVEAPAPPDEPRKTAPRTTRETVGLAATLAGVRGNVQIAGAGAAKVQAQTGMSLAPGQTLTTEGKGSLATLVFPDATRLEAGEDTTLVSAAGGREIQFSQGYMTVELSRQPKDHAVSYVTAHAVTRALGTRFVLWTEPDFTRVEVEAGLVKFTRRSDEKSADVKAGQYAVAGKGIALAPKPIYGTNLLADRGFEGGGQGWVVLTQTPKGNVSVVGSPARSGKRALLVAPVKSGMVQVGQRIPAAPGETFHVSGWIRTAGLDDVPGGALLSVMFLNASGAPVREGPLGSVKGTQDWTRLAGRRTAPPDTAAVQFFVAVHPDSDGAGGAWIDDCELMRVGR